MPSPGSAVYSDSDLKPYTQTYLPSYNPYDQDVDDLNYLQPQQTQDSYSPVATTPVLPPSLRKSHT